MCDEVHNRSEDLVRQARCTLRVLTTLLRPDDPAQGHKVTNAHKGICYRFRIHLSDCPRFHCSVQGTLIALADALIVAISSFGSNPFCFLNNLVDTTVGCDKLEEGCKASPLCL